MVVSFVLKITIDCEVAPICTCKETHLAKRLAAPIHFTLLFAYYFSY
jgi:hypothetical protein